MKKLLVCILSVALVLIAGSCTKEYGYVPVYGEIKVTPADAYPGDSLTATVEILQPGNGIYKGLFVWTIDGLSYNQILVEDLAANGPQFGFRAPKAGTHTIGCTAKRLYMSKVMETGQLYGSASARQSKFTVKSR